jgi:hypothetical protein
MTTEPEPSRWPWLPLGAALSLGAGAGWLVGATPEWAATGAVVGVGVVTMIFVFQIRTLVALSVGVGAGVGAYLGATAVAAVCQPQGCPAFEAAGAATTGIGALVGVGLVVTLVARSFDEYRESQRKGAPPATSSCDVDDRPSD